VFKFVIVALFVFHIVPADPISPLLVDPLPCLFGCGLDQCLCISKYYIHHLQVTVQLESPEAVKAALDGSRKVICLSTLFDLSIDHPTAPLST
jgi:hypothetical protein